MTSPILVTPWGLVTKFLDAGSDDLILRELQPARWAFLEPRPHQDRLPVLESYGDLKGLAAWFFRIDFHLNIGELATDAVDYSISIPLEHAS